MHTNEKATAATVASPKSALFRRRADFLGQVGAARKSTLGRCNIFTTARAFAPQIADAEAHTLLCDAAEDLACVLKLALRASNGRSA